MGLFLFKEFTNGITQMNQEDRDLLIRIDERVEVIQATLKKTDKQFASKWVERFNIGLIGVILLGVGNAMLGLVVKALNKGN